MNVALELVLILALIFANGLLSMAEIAIVSARKARLQQRAEDGDLRARLALELAGDPADFLSSVQVGITLVGILAGAFGGATLADHLAGWIQLVPRLAPYANAIALVIVVLLITYLTLILGELAPKRIALNNPERIAARVAGPMRLLARLNGPVVSLLSASTNAVLRLAGARSANEPPVTEDEIKVMLEEGTQAGVFEETEQEMVESVFRLSDRRLGSLMVPRLEIEWLDLEDSLEANVNKVLASRHASFPVARGDLDNVQGLLRAKDLLAHCRDGGPVDLAAILEEPVFVPETMPALKGLEIFRQSGRHQLLVIDEYGGLQGLVTTGDLLEAIVGDLPAAGEIEEPEAIQREDGSWLLDGMLPVDELKSLFRVGTLPNEERGYYQTLGGFVMDYLGRIPVSGDWFEWNGLRFEVMDMDGFRVDKVLALPVKKDGEDQN